VRLPIWLQKSQPLPFRRASCGLRYQAGAWFFSNFTFSNFSIFVHAAGCFCCENRLTIRSNAEPYDSVWHNPVGVRANTFGTGVIPDDRIAAPGRRIFDFRLIGVSKEFELNSPASVAKDGFFRKLAVLWPDGPDRRDHPP